MLANELLVNRDEHGGHDDEEHHDEAGIALAGLALGPGVVNDLLVASEQVAHHDVRHVALTVVPMAANTFQTKPKLPVVAARFLFLSTGGHWSNAVLNFGHRAEVKTVSNTGS